MVDLDGFCWLKRSFSHTTMEATKHLEAAVQAGIRAFLDPSVPNKDALDAGFYFWMGRACAAVATAYRLEYKGDLIKKIVIISDNKNNSMYIDLQKGTLSVSGQGALREAAEYIHKTWPEYGQHIRLLNNRVYVLWVCAG